MEGIFCSAKTERLVRRMDSGIYLSQCMIVKNEEENIQRALSWGKGIVSEQIVVDTGSTDRTVQIAQKMGAKVYSFPWIDDFSAAKNYAVDQAGGEWIAFLDADEYFSAEDAEELIDLLRKIDREFSSETRPEMVTCTWAHLDDSGRVFDVGTQHRIFRNVKELRYHNKIHEQLAYPDHRLPKSLNATSELTIFHTGYARSSLDQTKKLERNIRMLKKALEEKPADYNSMSYLADALVLNGREEEAERLWEKVITAEKDQVRYSRKADAFSCLMQNIVRRNEETEQERLERLYEEAVCFDPEFPDPDYWLGIWRLLHLSYAEGLYYLQLGLGKLEKKPASKDSRMERELENVYYMAAQACAVLKNMEDSVKYGVLCLQINRYREETAALLLSLLRQESPKETLGFLEKLYCLDELKDKLFLLKCSKAAGSKGLEQVVYGLLSDEEKDWLNGEEK